MLELFCLWCCKKAESRRARLFPQRPIATFRAYRGSIELTSNATQNWSVANKSKSRLRISTEKKRLCLSTRRARAVLSWRFARQFFEDPIELRERLKTDCERDFADAQIRIPQQITRILESDAGDVIDKIYARHLLERFTEMIRADIDCFRHLAERKFFA